MSRIMQTAIPAAIIAGVFALAAPSESWAQCGLSNGDCETEKLARQAEESCVEQMARTVGGRDQIKANGHAKTAEDYDLQADKWDELADAAMTSHLERAYRNEARGLRALADAEREKSMVHVAAANARIAECDQQVATLTHMDDEGSEDNSSQAEFTEDAQPAPATAASKKRPAKAASKKQQAKAAKRAKKRVVMRKRSRGKRVRLVRRARPRVVIGVGIGFGGIGIGF
jgi:hypothetical protein